MAVTIEVISLTVAENLLLVKVDLLEIFASEAYKYDVDFSDVRRQENVKRALEVAATTALMTKRPFRSPHHTISDEWG